MKAVILAGGKGTRLRPLTNDIPKPLVKIIDRPVILHILALLKEHGFTDVAVTVGYMADKIISEIGETPFPNLRVTYFKEDVPLGTAGSVKACADFLSDSFLIVSGDSYTNADLTEAVKFHEEKGSPFTVIGKELINPEGLGVIESDANGLITRFTEKPVTSGKKLVNTGMYVMNKKLLDLVPDGFYDFGKDLLPKLAGSIYCYTTRAYWSDIGTLPSYYYTNYLVSLKRA